MPSATAGRGAGVIAALLLVACGPDRGPREWIDERAAVVHCTSAGRDRMPPVLVDLPVPYPPSGMFAREMDPMALGDLGFQRDTVACAMLHAPDPDTAERNAEAVATLVETHDEVSAAAASVGTRCTCEIADSLGLEALVLACARRETQARCDVERFQAPMRDALQPMVDALAATPPPLVHWRLVGKTDRPGWLADHEADVVARHSGGSQFYVRGQAVPARRNFELIRGLLEVEGVTIVVRQDGGRSLLVVRELGSQLVLDHFTHPAIQPERSPLLAAFDNAHVEHYVSLLAKPGATRKLVHDPRDGNLVELDRRLLEAFDDSLLGAAPLGGGYPEAQQTREQPEVFVDHVAIQAPFGKEGQVLHVRARLTEDGHDWANLLPPDLLGPTLDELALENAAPVFVPPPGAVALPFVLRGTPTEALLFHGVHRVPELMRQVEISHPSTVQGKADAWQFVMPTDDLGAIVGADAPAKGLRTALSERPHTIEVGFDAAREHLDVEIEPR
jgi:hypothetical protein